jgi:hypothetical protein
MKTFNEIKNEVHDSSGVEDPHMYWWTNLFGVWLPHHKIEELEFHEFVKEFLDFFKLPQMSLDEIPNEYWEKCPPFALELRDSLLTIYHKL